MSRTDDRGEAPRDTERQAIRSLLGRVWSGITRHKALVAGMLVAGMLEALFTKGPFVLVKPLLDTLAPPREDPVTRDGGGDSAIAQFRESWFAWADDVKAWFLTTLQELCVSIRDLLGVTFETYEAEKTTLLGCALLAALAGVFGSAAIYAATVLSRYFATLIIVDLRNEVAAHLMRLPLGFFGRRKMGDLISNLTTDTTVLSRSFTLVADHAIVDPMMILVNVAIVAAFAPEVVPLFVLAIPLMALPMVRMGKKVHRRSRGSLEAMGDATESMNQMLSGIKTVKAFQLEPVRLDEFASSNRLYLDRTRRMLQTKARSQAFVFVGYQVLFAAMVLTLGWLLLGRYGSVGDIAVILIPVATTYTHVKRICRIYNTLMESLGAVDRIDTILDEREDVAMRGTGRPVETMRGDVELDRVSFAYGDEPVLREVSLTVPAGNAVAVVGPSGAGKTTCVDLIARFYDPDSGVIRVDGIDLREFDAASYRRNVAIVGQQPFLFNTSILENIRCGRPGASEEEVVAAARAAHIHEFITSLPDGYETSVGERGSNLSGGQMQRITIARAVLRDPAILILDEATSALDSESEEAVQRALAELMRGRTSFVIAHRLSTVRDADLILVLSEGRVVEVGDHASLVADGDGLYRRLVELQMR